MAHAIWKGTISFGLVTIPVGLFSAVAQRDVSFHLLDGRDFAAVKNRRVNESTGEEVPWESVVKGFKLPDGRWVTVTDEDFSAANVRATRTIDVLGAVCAEEVPATYWDTPYFLAPEPQGAKAYALLREALRRAGRVAIAQIVIRSRQRLCALVPEGDALLLEVLRYPYELRAAEDLDLPGRDLEALGVTDAELALAAQLVATIEGTWDPGAATTTPTETTCWRSSTARPPARRSRSPRSPTRPPRRWSTSSSCSRRASRTPAPRARRALRHRGRGAARGVPRQARLHAHARAGRRGRARSPPPRRRCATSSRSTPRRRSTTTSDSSSTACC